MFTRISGSLSRQIKALEILQALLEEEFSLLKQNKTDEIVDLEFSVHKLLQQLADEKEALIASLGGGKVLDFAEMRPKEEKDELIRLYYEVDTNEQICSRKASMNADLSISLLKQNDELLKGLTDAITPKELPTYGKKGGYETYVRPDAMLLSGRL